MTLLSKLIKAYILFFWNQNRYCIQETRFKTFLLVLIIDIEVAKTVISFLTRFFEVQGSFWDMALFIAIKTGVQALIFMKTWGIDFVSWGRVFLSLFLAMIFFFFPGFFLFESLIVFGPQLQIWVLRRLDRGLFRIVILEVPSW